MECSVSGLWVGAVDGEGWVLGEEGEEGFFGGGADGVEEILEQWLEIHLALEGGRVKE